MLLVVDIGNTQTLIGIYSTPSSERCEVSWRIATDKKDAQGDVRVKLFALMLEANIEASSIDATAIASVVPYLADLWMDVISSMFGVSAIRCTSELAMQAGLFTTDYPTPSEIGADRVADAIATKSLYGSSAFVVDFGTATNIEIIDRRGMFVGGIIAPGMMTSANAMFSQATKLAAVDLEERVSAVGYNTDEAVRCGIVLGEAVRADGLVLRAHEQLQDRMDPIDECAVVATGGLARLVAEQSRVITDVREDLTLVGLRLLAKAIL